MTRATTRILPAKEEEKQRGNFLCSHFASVFEKVATLAGFSSLQGHCSWSPHHFGENLQAGLLVCHVYSKFTRVRDASFEIIAAGFAYSWCAWFGHVMHSRPLSSQSVCFNIVRTEICIWNAKVGFFPLCQSKIPVQQSAATSGRDASSIILRQGVIKKGEASLHRLLGESFLTHF